MLESVWAKSFGEQTGLSAGIKIGGNELDDYKLQLREGIRNVYWMYGILIDEEEFGCSRDELKARLREQNIDTRYFFRPLHTQPLLAKIGLVDEGEFLAGVVRAEPARRGRPSRDRSSARQRPPPARSPPRGNRAPR